VLARYLFGPRISDNGADSAGLWGSTEILEQYRHCDPQHPTDGCVIPLEIPDGNITMDVQSAASVRILEERCDLVHAKVGSLKSRTGRSAKALTSILGKRGEDRLFITVPGLWYSGALFRDHL
jgi:hypothetical protein